MKKRTIKKDKTLLRPAIRLNTPARKVFKDKTKYNRKLKHKKAW